MAQEEGNKAKISRDEFNYIMQMYQNEYGLIERAIAETNEEIMGITSALEIVLHADLVSGKNSLQNIGADAFMESKVSNKIIIGVGAGYFVEMGRDAASEALNSKISRQKQSLERLSVGKKSIENELERMEQRVYDEKGR